MRKAIRFGLAGMVAVGLLAATPAAFAKPSVQAAVKASGKCSVSSTWKLKAKHDNGRIEVEFEVHEGVVGDVWDVSLSDNGKIFFQGTRTTKGTEGQFTIRKFTGNQAGTDMISGSATNQSTGETCQGSVSL